MIQPEHQVVQGQPCYVWAEAISKQIGDMITDHDNPEDRHNLELALFIALKQCPEAVEMLIGTPLIEEAWFENWERMEREEAEDWKQIDADMRKKAGE